MSRKTTESKLLSRLHQICQKKDHFGGLSGMTDAKLASIEVMLKKALKHIRNLRNQKSFE
ncbi:MAG: hypothetical protein LHW59_05420 [Candidatus Cloacimonetes bacterium]|nr:hypothetical protein [Candidatus Cloacimonadota bacterium]